MIQGQMCLFDFSENSQEIEKKGQSAINFSCFSTFRSGVRGIRYGKCVADHHCYSCEAYIAFYKKAEEYHKAGNSWGRSVALTKRFFGIPTVSEYEVEAYQ